MWSNQACVSKWFMRTPQRETDFTSERHALAIAFFLVPLRDRDRVGVAVVGGLLALALVPVAPPGVPVLAAGLAALWGLRRRDPS